MSSTTTTIKIDFDGQLRRLPKVSTPRSFASIAQEAARLFQINDSFVFEWRDADGDVIVMSSDAELDEAFGHAQEEGWKTLRLKLRLADPSNASPRGDDPAHEQVSPQSESGYVTVESGAPPSPETKQIDPAPETETQPPNHDHQHCHDQTELKEPAFDWSILHQLHQVLPLLLGSEEAHLVLEIIRQHATAVTEQQQRSSDQSEGQEQQKRQEAEAEEHLRNVLLPVVSALLQVHPVLVPPLRRLLASPAVQRVLHSTEAEAETDPNTAIHDKEQQEQEQGQGGPFANMSGCPVPPPLLFAMMGGAPSLMGGAPRLMGGPRGHDPCGGPHRGGGCPLPLPLLFAMRGHDSAHGQGRSRCHMFRSVARPVLAVFQAALGEERKESETTNKNKNEGTNENSNGGNGTATAATETATSAAPTPSSNVYGGRPAYTLQYDDQEQERELDRLMQMAMEESLAQQAA